MRKTPWLVPALFLLWAGTGIAKASPITFDVQATLLPSGGGTTCVGAGCALAGTIVIDTTTGALDDLKITFTDGSLFSEFPPESEVPFPFAGIVEDETEGANYYIEVMSGPPGVTAALGYYLSLVLPVTTLVGYTGGPLEVCGVGDGGITTTCELGTGVAAPTLDEEAWALTSGSLSPAVVATATPEPDSFGLTLIGIGLVLMTRKRIATASRR